MTARSHLVATPITDRKGKRTTVYRKPAAHAVGHRPLPAPCLSAAAPQPTAEESAYRERLETVAAANERWNRDAECERLDELKMGALEALSSVMTSVAFHAGEGNRQGSEEFAEVVHGATSRMEYGRIISANKLAPLYEAFANDDDLDPCDEDACGEALEADCYGWAPENLCGVMFVVGALQDLDLLSRDEVPDNASDPRFCAHLWASARGVIDYTRTTDHAYIRLLDEHPADAEAIASGVGNGLHPEGVRALIEGRTSAALAVGAI